MQFRKESEYDFINKKIRPHVIKCIDAQYLCDAIDLLKEPHINQKLMKETLYRLFSDL